MTGKPETVLGEADVRRFIEGFMPGMSPGTLPYGPTPEQALRALDALAARLQAAEAERDHYRFHFDQEQERAEKAEGELVEWRTSIATERLEVRLREAEKTLREIMGAGRLDDFHGIARAYFAAQEQP